ncbi:MAG: AAA family ATPase [Prosthecobacter sp.]
MISEIQIENFKSIAKLSLKPGRVTVLIGENGSGKSNILEAIAFAAAASAGKLDDEFLYNRGIRVTDEEWMRSAFVPEKNKTAEPPQLWMNSPITVRVFGDAARKPLGINIRRDISGRDQWSTVVEVDEDDIRHAELNHEYSRDDFTEIRSFLAGASGSECQLDELAHSIAAKRSAMRKRIEAAPEIAAQMTLKDFLIYSPENTVLRTFSSEGAIKPLGPKGEGLLKLLQTSAVLGNGKFTNELKESLALLGWFGDVWLPTGLDEMQGRLALRDRWLSDTTPRFDQRSANEGFLYLLFYFTLFLSPQTPRFFAIDNLDNALNPKLCAELMRQLAVLAEKSGKQVICTTHNPAILDGLNLQDDMQRLYVVRRNSEGHTVVNRVSPPRPRPDGATTRLSAAFMSGMLGGLPEHF